MSIIEGDEAQWIGRSTLAREEANVIIMARNTNAMTRRSLDRLEWSSWQAPNDREELVGSKEDELEKSIKLRIFLATRRDWPQ